MSRPIVGSDESCQTSSLRVSVYLVQKWLLTVLKRILLVSCHTASSQFSDPMQQHHCQKSFTCWHATELQVWWLLVSPYFFSHDWSGTEYMFNKKLRNCEPIDLNRFVVDLRERHLEFLTPYSDGCIREHNSKFLTYNCALPPKKALATRSPYSLPKYMFLDLPRDVIHSAARFRLRVHTLCFETATWNPRSSPICNLCEADDDVQDEQHAIFHCTHPHTVSLRRRYESLFSKARARDVFTCLHQNNNRLYFFPAWTDCFLWAG
jgi:hypothetical protein